MNARVYIPCDTSAIACGADAVAQEIREEASRRGIGIEIVRNGSRGLCWLEPLVEINTAQGRFGFGPVTAGAVAAMFDAGFPHANAHALSLGPVEDIAWLKKQQRVCFARNGVIDPLDWTISSATAAGRVCSARWQCSRTRSCKQ